MGICGMCGDWQFDEDMGAVLCSGDELLRQLSGAIRGGNRTEAEILLDKIADYLGPVAQEAVAAGRFMHPPGVVKAA